MSEDTIYERVAKLEDDLAALRKETAPIKQALSTQTKLEDELATLRKDVDILNVFSKNKLAKLEIQKIKKGNL